MNISNPLSLFLICVACLAVSGCAVRAVTPPSSRPPYSRPSASHPPAQRKPVESGNQSEETLRDRNSPRAVAALTLTEQAGMLLKNGQPDEAISVLERAINLNPVSGQNYYYLCEAWLMKKNFTQAAECNNLAADYFQGNSSWMARVIEQKKRIQALLKP